MLVKMDLQLLNTYNHPNWLSLFGSRHFWFVRDIDIQDILFFRCMLCNSTLVISTTFPSSVILHCQPLFNFHIQCLKLTRYISVGLVERV